MKYNRFKSIILAIALRLVRIGIVREPMRILAQRGILPDPVWQRLPHEVEFKFRGPESASFRYSGDRSDDMARRLLWKGWRSWEPETTPLWCGLARKGLVALDIGAYTGYFSLLALSVNPNLHVVAFEPMPGQRSSLERNLSLNGWGDRATVVPHAVGSSRYEARMRGWRPMELTAAVGAADERGMPVKVVTIDDQMTNNTVDLIKIDVEGAESQVLLGARTVLERDSPVIICEILTSAAAIGVSDALEGLGYDAYKITCTGLLPVQLLSYVPDSKFRNVLLCPAGPSSPPRSAVAQ